MVSGGWWLSGRCGGALVVGKVGVGGGAGRVQVGNAVRGARDSLGDNACLEKKRTHAIIYQSTHGVAN